MWLDPIPVKTSNGKVHQPVKLMGIVSWGTGECKYVKNILLKVCRLWMFVLNSESTVPCGLGGMYARVSLIVDWINRVTENCNMETCCKDQCVSKDKLKPQALEMLVT